MLTDTLVKELAKEMSVDRLAKTGLFIKLPISNPTIHAELKLHRAVLDRALLDLFHPREDIKKKAVRWLDPDNKDFIECCLRADLDPALVYNLFIEIRKILKGDNAKFTTFKHT